MEMFTIFSSDLTSQFCLGQPKHENLNHINILASSLVFLSWWKLVRTWAWSAITGIELKDPRKT